MKISQKLVSLRCRVLVKNKRLVVFWLLTEMRVLVAWVRQEEHLSPLRVALSATAATCALPSPEPSASLSSSGSGSAAGDRRLP